MVQRTCTTSEQCTSWLALTILWIHNCQKIWSIQDINGFHFHSTIFEDAHPLAATCNTGVVVRAVNVEGQETNYYGVIKDILELTFGGDKDLRVVFFYYDWFDPTHGTRENKYGMVEIKREERVGGHDNFVLALMSTGLLYDVSMFKA
jgi:hypothetical protein